MRLKLSEPVPVSPRRSRNRHRFLQAVLVCAWAAWVPPAAAAVETFALSNGMEVIVLPNHRVPAVTHMLWLRAGAADDPQGKSGLAHFHEHLMFQGTAQYASGEYSDIIARHGGQHNAFTGHDAIAYHVSIAKEHLPLVMELEADRMRGLKPLDSDVAKEKQVILEERRMRVDNHPEALLAEQMNAALLRHHPYRLPVIGWMHEMETLTRQDVLDFHRKYYHPGNAILIVSGDITAQELKPLAQRHYGKLRAAATPPRQWTQEPPQIAPRRITLRHANVKQPILSRSYMAASLGYGEKDDALPLFALAQLLGGGKTSRLYQSLVVEKKIASAASASYSGFRIGPGEFGLRIVPEGKASLTDVEQAMDAELKRLLKDGVTEDELARAKTLLKAESVFARDGLSSMARVMGWVRITGLSADYFGLWPEMIERITAGQVLEAAKRTLDEKQSVTGLLLPETGGEKP